MTAGTTSVRAVFRRAFAQAFAGGGGLLAPAGFYASCAALLPLAVGPKLSDLALIAPGYLIITLALASLLSLERLFARDLEDGVMDVLTLTPCGLGLGVCVQMLAHWLAIGLGLALLAPVLGLGLGLSAPQVLALLPVMVLCSLAFCAIGAVAAALTLSSRRGGLLIALIALPLFAPPAIFASAALDTPGAMGLLAAYTLAAVALSPLAVVAAVRTALD